MRFRLLRRRLTISAPKMAIRSTLPWPLRWVIVAVVLGFCAAISLWTFEFGRDIAGLDRESKDEIPRLRSEVARLTQERDKAQSIANTAGSLLAAGQATQDQLTAQNKLLAAESQSLRDDLGFFQKLLPVSGSGGISIRGLQAEVLADSRLKWQVLVFQAVKNPAEFSGKLELTFSGLRNGKPWSMALPEAETNLQFKQYRRLAGVLELPADVVLKKVAAQILDGAVVRATQTVNF
jgi:hypothetical protein